MSVLFVTLTIALLLGAVGLFACIRCIKTGQYDDLDMQAMRILQNDQHAVQSKSDASEMRTDTVAVACCADQDMPDGSRGIRSRIKRSV